MDSVEMSWGMAKATNPSDSVTGHRPLQMISQIFVDMSHSKYVQHVHCSSRLYSLLVGQFVFETPCNFTSLQPSSSILVLMLVRTAGSSARKSKFGSGRSPTWRSMRHAFGWQLMDSLPLFAEAVPTTILWKKLCVFLGHASKWKEALSWSLIIRIYEDHLDSS